MRCRESQYTGTHVFHGTGFDVPIYHFTMLTPFYKRERLRVFLRNTEAQLTCYASAFRRRRRYVFGLFVRQSEARNIPFPSVMCSLVHPTNRDSFAACPSVRPDRFPDIFWRTHGENIIKYRKLMYPDNLQNCLDCCHGLLIFLNFAGFFLLSETGQICGFRTFPRERLE